MNKVGEGVRERDEGEERRRSNRCSFRVVCLVFFSPTRSLFSGSKKKSLELVGNRRTFQFGEKGFRVPITVV